MGVLRFSFISYYDQFSVHWSINAKGHNHLEFIFATYNYTIFCLFPKKHDKYTYSIIYNW